MNEQWMAERAEIIATKRDQIDGLVRQLREATAAKDQAVLAERERCAQVVESYPYEHRSVRVIFAKLIRGRPSSK